MAERLIVVSTDCHAGLPIADYKPYVESRYHEMMDMAVPVQLEMMEMFVVGVRIIMERLVLKILIMEMMLMNMGCMPQSI